MIDLVKFNDLEGGPTLISNMNGDFIIRVEVARQDNSTDPEGTLAGEAFLLKCKDSSCIEANTPLPDPNKGYRYFDLNLGQVKIKEKFTLRIIWDQPNHAFIVGLNDYNTTLVYDPSYEKYQSTAPFASIRTQLYPANCLDLRTEAQVETEVFQVRTNVSAIKH